MPAVAKLSPVWIVLPPRLQRVQQILNACIMAAGAKPGAEVGPPQIKHIGIEYVALAVAVNRGVIAGGGLFRYIAAVTVPFTGRPSAPGRFVQAEPWGDAP